MYNTSSLATPLVKNIFALKDKWFDVEVQFKLLRHKIKDFRPKVPFEIVSEKYLLKTATESHELEKCLKLRYEIFYHELLEKKRSHGVDVDHMDLACDHIMIIDRTTEEVVGTYRVVSSRHTEHFYSESEFAMENLLKLPGEKIELGRACIAKSHRTGAVMQLLWKGISQYIKLTESRFLFGCTSVRILSPSDTVLIALFLEKKGWTRSDIEIKSKPKYEFALFENYYASAKNTPLTSADCELAQKMLPALFLSYIRAGAKALLPPALDRAFRCFDFLTVLDIDELNAAHRKRFLGSSEPACQVGAIARLQHNSTL